MQLYLFFRTLLNIELIEINITPKLHIHLY